MTEKERQDLFKSIKEDVKECQKHCDTCITVIEKYFKSIKEIDKKYKKDIK